MGLRSEFSEVLVTELKFLAFRPVRPDVKRLRWHFLVLGLVSSWLAGMGRYWDTSEAQWWQYAGLGSVVYTFFMATFLFALILPMHPRNWSYLNVLTFVGMTAPPAIFYAIPVERFTDPTTASQVNYGFLIVVATWRVGLLWLYLRRSAQLRIVPAMVALMLPLALMMVVLAYMQLSMTVMEGMAGIRTEQPKNLAGEFIVSLGFISFWLTPFLGVGYIVCAAKAADRSNREAGDAAALNDEVPSSLIANLDDEA